MDKKIIEFRKKYNDMISTAKKNAKRGECIWCHKKITKFCNSHSVPRFILHNIENNGHVEYFNDFLDMPFLDNEKGLNEAGTFRLLCKECDSLLFKDYEDPIKLAEYPSEILLEEIALKNVLFMLNKRYFEVAQTAIMKEQQIPYFYEQKEEVNNLDIMDYEWDYFRIRSMIENDANQDKFKVIYWQKLPYKVPIAYQGLLTIYGDFEGKLAADIYDKNPDNHLPHINVAVFPLDNYHSIIMMFYHEDDNVYDAFSDQFSKLAPEDKLSVVNFLIWKNTEDMLISPRIPHKTFFINQIRHLALSTTSFMAPVKEAVQLSIIKEKTSLLYRDKEIPNVLSEKYKLH